MKKKEKNADKVSDYNNGLLDAIKRINDCIDAVTIDIKVSMKYSTGDNNMAMVMMMNQKLAAYEHCRIILTKLYKSL